MWLRLCAQLAHTAISHDRQCASNVQLVNFMMRKVLQHVSHAGKARIAQRALPRRFHARLGLTPTQPTCKVHQSASKPTQAFTPQRAASRRRLALQGLLHPLKALVCANSAKLALAFLRTWVGLIARHARAVWQVNIPRLNVFLK